METRQPFGFSLRDGVDKLKVLQINKVQPSREREGCTLFGLRNQSTASMTLEALMTA
jgi:hypothetical protein